MSASPAQRPAETGAIGGSIAVVIARIFTKDPDILAAVGAAVGVVPAAITWFVELVKK